MNPLSHNEIEVRQAIGHDAAMLAQLVSEMDDGPPGSVEECSIEGTRTILAEMAAYPYFRAYLAFDQGIPVGTFSLMIFSSPSHGGAPQAMLDAVVVARSRRGSGIGKRMIRKALEIAALAGCYKMTLSSNLKRADAHRFYEQLGFSQHGISFSTPLPLK